MVGHGSQGLTALRPTRFSPRPCREYPLGKGFMTNRELKCNLVCSAVFLVLLLGAWYQVFFMADLLDAYRDRWWMFPTMIVSIVCGVFVAALLAIWILAVWLQRPFKQPDWMD